MTNSQIFSRRMINYPIRQFKDIFLHVKEMPRVRRQPAPLMDRIIV